MGRPNWNDVVFFYDFVVFVSSRVGQLDAANVQAQAPGGLDDVLRDSELEPPSALPAAIC